MTRCYICRYEKLKLIVDQLRRQGKTYRDIQRLLDSYGIHVSLGVLSRHFQEELISKLDSIVPTLREGEAEISEKQMEKIFTAVVDKIMELPIEKAIQTKELLERKMKELDELEKSNLKINLATNMTVWETLQYLLEDCPDVLEHIKPTYIQQLRNLNIPVPTAVTMNIGNLTE